MSDLPVTQSDVNDAIDELLEHLGVNGKHKYSGMTYEEGIRAALEWVLGDVEEFADIL